MAYVTVSQLKPGDKIIQDVMTQKNNLLMNKGIVLTDREIEILNAFLITKVHIESDAATDHSDKIREEADKQIADSLLAFHDAYEKMFVLMKRIFSLAASSGTIPILDIRTRLEALLALSDGYNIISFKPANYHPRDYLIHHSIQTSLSSYVFAKWLGFTQKDLVPIAIGGLLHDIGSTKIDPAYFSKTTPLSATEIEEIRSHTILGYQILKSVAAMNEGSKLTALQHHERMDGSGYPSGLKADQIHVYSRIIAIADVYHAMTTQRLYRSAMSPYLVMEELSKESFGKLDPSFVQTFIHKITQFHTGMIVRLNDNRIGKIVFSQREHPTRPWVSVNGTIVNLVMERKVYIQDIIQ